MKIYYKNDQIVERPRSLYFNGKTYVPPTDELLLEAGYKIVIPGQKPLTNEDIKQMRAKEYALRADQHFLAFQAYTELGLLDKAEQEKQIWLQVRQDIDTEFPYVDESTLDATEDVVLEKPAPIIEVIEDDEFN